jgi:hypothetical protein
MKEGGCSSAWGLRAVLIQDTGLANSNIVRFNENKYFSLQNPESGGAEC